MKYSASPAPTSLVDQMEAQQAILGLSNEDLCTALGFERHITLTLIQAGTMKLPLNKVPALAAVLELDPVELLRTALSETDPDLLRVIEEVFNSVHLSATEMNLVRHLRELSGERQGAPIVLGGKGVIALVTV